MSIIFLFMVTFLILKFEGGKNLLWHSDKIALLSWFKIENVSKWFFYIDTAGRFVKLGINFIFFIGNWSSGEFKEPHGMLSIYFWACLKDICWGCRRPEQSFTHSVHPWTLRKSSCLLSHCCLSPMRDLWMPPCVPWNNVFQEISRGRKSQFNVILRDLAIFVEFTTFQHFQYSPWQKSKTLALHSLEISMLDSKTSRIYHRYQLLISCCSKKKIVWAVNQSKKM